jgi:hypothetical protein
MAEYKPATSGLCTFSTVASAAASTSLLAANSKRKGGSVFNTDANALCIRMDGGTATTTTGFNVRLTQNQYFEIPFGYTGAITGIWEVDGAGAANIAEYT